MKPFNKACYRFFWILFQTLYCAIDVSILSNSSLKGPKQHMKIA